MSTLRPVPEFWLVSGANVSNALRSGLSAIRSIVTEVYRAHGNGRTINPPSYFLNFTDRPGSRIIALPGSIDDEVKVDGLKWISSFPDNIKGGMPRASGVIILNNPETGYPFACLEASIISASRTAASAAVAAEHMVRGRPPVRRLGFVGAGLIARNIFEQIWDLGWDLDEVLVCDLHKEYAQSFAEQVQRYVSDAVRVCVLDSANDVVRASDIIVFATTSSNPYIDDVSLFDHHPIVLHVSLRDLGTSVIASAFNVVDDIDHVLKANTSVHLLEQASGSRDFIDGTLFDILENRLAVPTDRTAIFSPFGLGVLDLALANFAFEKSLDAGVLSSVPNFFYEMNRFAPVGESSPDSGVSEGLQRPC